ncbi:trypsin-like serine protease [Streptomyces sp. bgisy029]|uniref:trypsin-like serine protease n=1 Tax=Streptomyces sp. bgisy029 TaxID=3413771 RepID=UPI003D746A64
MPRRRVQAFLATLAVSVFAFLMPATAGAASPQPPPGAGADVSPQVIGGTPASQAYPVGVWNACTVVLIKPDWLLTAAHCTWRNGYVGIGTDSASPVAVSSTDRRVFFTGGGADVALLHLATPVTNVKPVLIDRFSPVAGTPARVVGFGQTCPTPGCGGATTKALELDTAVLDDAACPAIHNGNTEICGDNPAQAGTCYGDSGGPLLRKTPQDEWVLVGLVSGWGTANTDCGAAPSIFADVTEKGGVRQWIAQTVGGLADPGTTPPTDPPTDPPGDTCTLAQWKATAVYTGGSVVAHDGRKWKAKWWTTNEMPGTTGQWGVWQDEGAC